MRVAPSIAWVIVGFFVGATLAFAHAPATDMLDAAQKFLDALGPEQKSKVTYPLTDAQRETWYFIPIARGGLPFSQMTGTQHRLALELLRTGLSQTGFAQAEAIVGLENVLKELEHGAAHRDPTHYYVTLFATPSAKQSWGWRFEGHHLSFNVTVVDGAHVFVTPSFMGSNPGEVRAGPQTGLNVLGEEENLGRALVKSLEVAQLGSALISAQAPSDILTGNRARVEPLAPVGLSVERMQPDQRDRLQALLKVYLQRYRSEIADAEFAKITAGGWEKISFAWAGGLEPGMGHYYRIQGPTFLIEFDNTQDHANHIHTVWRDFKGDFGRDLLREHYVNEHAGR